jgi:hypothetical protein
MRRHSARPIGDTVLHDLTEDHLPELGIPLGARLKLLKAIAVLGARAEATRPSAADATSSGPPVDAAERRQVTVMFSDLGDQPGRDAHTRLEGSAS